MEARGWRREEEAMSRVVQVEVEGEQQDWGLRRGGSGVATLSKREGISVSWLASVNPNMG